MKELCAIIGIVAALTTDAYCDIPADAKSAAAEYFRESWTQEIQQGPAFLGLDLLCDHAVLEPGIAKYYGDEGDLEEYVASTDSDPRNFLKLRRYEFPVTMDGFVISTIWIRPDSQVRHKGFALPWVTGYHAQKIYQSFPAADGYSISSFAFDATFQGWLIENRAGSLFALKGLGTAVPIEEAAAIWKRQISKGELPTLWEK
jgi:hypothetical protein